MRLTCQTRRDFERLLEKADPPILLVLVLVLVLEFPFPFEDEDEEENEDENNKARFRKDRRCLKAPAPRGGSSAR